MANHVVVDGIRVDQEEIDAAFSKVRAKVDGTGYGGFVSDDLCRELAAEVVAAVENYRAGK